MLGSAGPSRVVGRAFVCISGFDPGAPPRPRRFLGVPTPPKKTTPRTKNETTAKQMLRSTVPKTKRKCLALIGESVEFKLLAPDRGRSCARVMFESAQCRKACRCQRFCRGRRSSQRERGAGWRHTELRGLSPCTGFPVEIRFARSSEGAAMAAGGRVRAAGRPPIRGSCRAAAVATVAG